MGAERQGGDFATPNPGQVEKRKEVMKCNAEGGFVDSHNSHGSE